jgi:hypothetical protein
MPEATSNVIRFPVERRRRDDVGLLYDLIPDIRVVSANAEAFGFELPEADLYDRADRDMAEYILNNVRPEPGFRRAAELDRLLSPVIGEALELCRRASGAVSKASSADERLEIVRRGGYSGVREAEEAAISAWREATRLQLGAYEASQEALGAARAVVLAKEGVPWMARVPRDEERMVFGI